MTENQDNTKTERELTELERSAEENRLVAAKQVAQAQHTKGTLCWLVASTVFLAVLALFMGMYIEGVFDGDDGDGTINSIKPPPPVEIPVVPSVRSEVVFNNLDISAFTSPTFDAAFRTNFTRAMAGYAGVGADRVSISSIAAGSVK
eukprot:3329834-Pyramimonas_sp.AAC.1